jgi:hypothetical protein
MHKYYIRQKENLDLYLCMNPEYGYWGKADDLNILEFDNIEELELFAKNNVKKEYVIEADNLDFHIKTSERMREQGRKTDGLR